MNIEDIIFDKKLGQFKKRNLLAGLMLNKSNCRIGNNVKCFEIENMYSDESSYNFYKHKIGVGKLKTISLGKNYTVINIKDGYIKIKNDSNSYIWCSMKRFLFDIKEHRRLKIEEINKNSEQVYL